MKSDMGITPNVPGTGPVTDIPQRDDRGGGEPATPDVQPGGLGPGDEDQRDVRIPTDTARQDTPVDPELNPFSGSPSGGTGGVNPSAPTTGTEDWGRRPGEAEAASDELGERGMHFRCSELHPACRWEASGRTEDELMPLIEQHGREKHGLQSLGQIKDRVRNAIRRLAA